MKQQTHRNAGVNDVIKVQIESQLKERTINHRSISGEINRQTKIVVANNVNVKIMTLEKDIAFIVAISASAPGVRVYTRVTDTSHDKNNFLTISAGDSAAMSLQLFFICVTPFPCLFYINYI